MNVFVILGFATDYITVIAAIFAFPFLHDGAYYATREDLKPGTYPKGIWDQSSTSTAWTTKIFTPVVRTIFAAVGGAIFITNLILKTQ